MSDKAPKGSMFAATHFPRAYARERRENYTHLVTASLFIGDMVLVGLSLLFGFWLRFHSFLSDFGVPSGHLPTVSSYFFHFLLALVAMLALLTLNRHYSGDRILRPLYSSLMMLKPIIIWGAIFTSLSLMFKIEPSISRLFVMYSLLTMVVLLPFWRYVFSRLVIIPFCSNYIRNKTLIIGWNDRVKKLVDRSEAKDVAFPLRISGVVTTRPGDDLTQLPDNLNHWRLAENFNQVIRSSDFDTILLADSDLDYDSKIEIQQLCAREMMDFMVLPSHIAILPHSLSVHTLQGMPILTQKKRQSHRLDVIIFKRLVDIFGALAGLVIFSPVIAYFCWRVKKESPGPAFYRQVRLTRSGKSFEIIKIRSMRLDAESISGAKWCEAEDPRRLKIGTFIRKMNIDELPQFWNVLRGDMSLVGPRPERPELIEEFKSRIDYYNLRHSLKAGMTGWAQVNGWRGDTNLQARIACDIEYIERSSFWFDLYIILRTITARKNAY